MQQQGDTNITRNRQMSAPCSCIVRRGRNDTATDLAQCVGNNCLVKLSAQRDLIAQGPQVCI